MSQRDWLALALVLGLGALRFWHSSQEAAEPGYVPDAVEYAVGAQRIATLGRFDLALGGSTYPSRYAPWFSLWLAPAYLVAPQQLGAGIWIVWCFALLAVAASYMIGRALAGSTGACFAACALLAHPWLSEFARDIMTDIPATALGLCALAISLNSARITPLRAAGIGCVIAAAAALRPTAFSFALPVLGLVGRRYRLLLLLAAPCLCMQLCTWLYQYRTFGDALRTGYQFWCPVPYDYRDLVWSFAYVKTNAALLAHPKLYVPIALGVIGAAIQARHTRWPALMLGLVSVPIALFHLLYFFTQSRFWLPIVYLCLVIGGAGCAAAALRMRWLVPLVWFSAAAWVMHGRIFAVERPGARTELVRALQQLPEDAMIITDLDAAYLEPQVLRGTQRSVLPATRHAEYANKLVAWKSQGPLSPAPQSATDHRALGLQHSAALEVFPHTADESLPMISARVNAGLPTYCVLSTTPWNEQLQRALTKHLRAEPLPTAPLVQRLISVR